MSDETITPIARAEALSRSALRPPQPQLAAAIEVVTGIDRAIIDAALASEWKLLFFKHHAQLEWVDRDARGARYSRVDKAPSDRLRDPLEAWEMLAGRGLIPDDWVGSNARRFARGQRAAAPASLAGAIALASDPEGVLEAERLAREIAGRLIDWGVGRAPRVVWHVDEPLHWISSGESSERYGRSQLAMPGGQVMQELMATIGYSVPSAQFSRNGRRLLRSGTLCKAAQEFTRLAPREDLKPIANLLDAHEEWVAARRAGRAVRIARPGGIAGEFVEHSTTADELPDPFEPLFMLLARGYVLIELTRRSIQLYAECRIASG